MPLASSSTHPRDTSSRTWWSRSLKPALPTIPKDLRQPLPVRQDPLQSKNPSISFSSFAYAVGLKSKKSGPSLTIQDPPPTIRTTAIDFPRSPILTNIPPSKSVSSFRSRAESIGPLTPIVGPLEARQSLLTLSDVDPFAGRSIVAVSSPHIPSYPNRISLYSEPSPTTEIIPTKHGAPMATRVSYASSSSLSHNNSDSSPLSPTLSPISTAGGSSTMDSPISPHKSGSPNNSLRKSDSFSANTHQSYQHIPPPPPRSLSRPRGLTDSASPQRPPYPPSQQLRLRPAPQRPATAQQPSSTLSSPRVVIRQTSMSRIGIILPPTAPPAHGLPATPQLSISDSPVEDETLVTSSHSSSSLSFASSVSSTRDQPANKKLLQGLPHISQRKDKEPFDVFHTATTSAGRSMVTFNSPPSTSQLLPSSNRTLKKASSHSSIGKRISPLQASVVLSSEKTIEKTPRKQRSFHNPRIPLPAISLPLFNPNSTISTPSSETGSILDSKRGSSSPIPPRKRLFSASSLRRPSTSQCTPVEDDTFSVFSLGSVQDQPAVSSLFKPWISTQSSTQPSFWDDCLPETAPNSPGRVPQQIMSPAEMAKVDASVETASLVGRKRGFSIVSASTMGSEVDDTESIMSGLSLPPPSWPAVVHSTPSRANSVMVKSSTLPLRISNRPSTAQAQLGPTSSEQTLFRPSSSPPLAMASLPPPPRPRQRPGLNYSTSFTPISTPSARTLRRPKTSVEKSLHHRSLMRKSSFLDIDDDETDKEIDGELPSPDGGKPLNSSFLDLARESFDTFRSTD